MTRSIPPALVPILEHLELERPMTVSRKRLTELALETGVGTPVNVIIQRLSKRGWLKETDVRGVWEFLPAERAGPHSFSDQLTALRATLTNSPNLPIALAFGSALWLLDIADRAPDVAEVALPPGKYVPPAIRRNYRVFRHETRLDPIQVQGLPVHSPATVLVHLANRPTDVRSWASVLTLLPILVDESEVASVLAELEDRTHATRIRLAYLLSGVAPVLVEEIGVERAGKVWFGPRRTLLRHNARWNVADTILPFSPTDLEPLS